MKINEFGKSQKVDEDFKSGLQTVSNAVIGDRATSAIKGMFTGNAEQGAEDNFVKMFTTNITARLKNAISTGLVSPNPQNTPTTDKQTNDATSQQPAAQPKSQPQLGGPKPQPKLGGPKPKPQLGGPGDNPRLSEPPPIPPGGPQPKGPASPADDYIDAEWSEVTPDKKLSELPPLKTLSQADYDQILGKQGTRAPAAPASAPKAALPAPAAAPAAKGIKSGGAIKQAQATPGTAPKFGKTNFTAPNAGVKMKESSQYDKLNALFESILEADTTAKQVPSKADINATTQPQEGPESISQFLTDWYTQYMKGYNWQPRKPMFDKLFKSVEDTYKQDGGKQALRKLAQASFAITGGGMPDKEKPTDTNKEQPKEPVQPAQPAAQTTTPTQPADAATVQQNLNALRKADPKGYAAIVNKIISDYKKTYAGGTPPPAAPAAPTTPPPTPPAAPTPQVSGPKQNPQLPAPKK